MLVRVVINLLPMIWLKEMTFFIEWFLILLLLVRFLMIGRKTFFEEILSFTVYDL